MPADSQTTEYDRGWDDGYAEGYACKLVDVGTLLAPKGTAVEVEAAASWLSAHYATYFSKFAAIGAARAMLQAAKETAQCRPIIKPPP